MYRLLFILLTLVITVSNGLELISPVNSRIFPIANYLNPENPLELFPTIITFRGTFKTRDGAMGSTACLGVITKNRDDTINLTSLTPCLQPVINGVVPGLFTKIIVTDISTANGNINNIFVQLKSTNQTRYITIPGSSILKISFLQPSDNTAFRAGPLDNIMDVISYANFEMYYLDEINNNLSMFGSDNIGQLLLADYHNTWRIPKKPMPLGNQFWLSKDDYYLQLNLDAAGELLTLKNYDLGAPIFVNELGFVRSLLALYIGDTPGGTHVVNLVGDFNKKCSAYYLDYYSRRQGGIHAEAEATSPTVETCSCQIF